MSSSPPATPSSGNHTDPEPGNHTDQELDRPGQVRRRDGAEPFRGEHDHDADQQRRKHPIQGGGGHPGSPRRAEPCSEQAAGEEVHHRGPPVGHLRQRVPPLPLGWSSPLPPLAASLLRGRRAATLSGSGVIRSLGVHSSTAQSTSRSSSRIVRGVPAHHDDIFPALISRPACGAAGPTSRSHARRREAAGSTASGSPSVSRAVQSFVRPKRTSMRSFALFQAPSMWSLRTLVGDIDGGHQPRLGSAA